MRSVLSSWTIEIAIRPLRPCLSASGYYRFPHIFSKHFWHFLLGLTLRRINQSPRCPRFLLLHKYFLKLINYSWGQQPINEAYLGHMHEPWYPMNTQMKILWVLIWDQTWFWSQIKHLHFNEHFSKINSSLITIPKMTWILFDIINLDGVGYHKLFHKRSSVDISPPTSWPPPSHTC